MDSTRLATAAEVDYTTERQWQQATTGEKDQTQWTPESRGVGTMRHCWTQKQYRQTANLFTELKTLWPSLLDLGFLF